MPPTAVTAGKDRHQHNLMKENDMEFFIIIAVVCGVIGAMIADDKVMGAFLGAMLGPIGLVIAAIMKGK